MNGNESIREIEKLDSGWLFHKGDIHIPQAIKAGAIGGYTDSRDLGDLAPDQWCQASKEWLALIYRDDKWMDKLTHKWIEVDLPHDWNVEQDYIHEEQQCIITNVSGYLQNAGVSCYRKNFDLPESDKGKKIYIEFDGISRNSTIWVNGFRLGMHYSGYTSFTHDITDIALYGNEGTNTIFVRVDASEPEGWWYEGSGIYRHVRIVKCNRLHVAQWGTYVTAPKISERSAGVNISVKIQNEYAEDKGCILVSTILDSNDGIISSESMDAAVPANGFIELQQIQIVENPHLWSPDSPYLYKVLTKVKIAGEIVDVCETAFGIRTIEFDKDEGFFLNGKQTVIKGICCHQDFAGLGVALPEGIIEYKMRLLKEMGANAYRSAHNPPTPELLDICDRLGIMVLDENRRLDSTEEGINELESMLYRDRNHPCIILWSMQNEELLEGTEIGKRILKHMVDITHKIDPTRPATAATLRKEKDKLGFCDILDIVGCNYHTKEGINVKDRKMHPNRKMLHTETIGFFNTRGIYGTDPEKGYFSSYTHEKAIENKKEGFSAKEEKRFYAAEVQNFSAGDNSPEHVWMDLMKHPYMTGIFIWTGFDYRGESKWPSNAAQTGIMDMCGFPKDIYYYWKSQWTDEPMVHVFPHWNWHGSEGREIEVWVYTNCDSVELFVNGQSLGVKEAIPYSHIAWKVGYTPGVLYVSGMKNGKVAVEKKVVTSNAPSKIILEPHKNIIMADGCDVSVFRVYIQDEKGNVVPTADNKIKFTLNGPGKILGTGNGDPSDHESDKSNIRRAFNGCCMVIVQSGKETGRIVLEAESEGLMAASAAIDAR